MTDINLAPSSAPLANLEIWLQSHRGQQMVLTTRDPSGWFSSRTRGKLTEVIRDDPGDTEHTLELRLDGGRHEQMLHGDQVDEIRACDDPSTTGDGLTIALHHGSIDIEAEA